MPLQKNTAGQFLYATLASAVDGTAITAGATVFLAGDGGAQAAGTGTLAHKGNGQWSYALSQAESNVNVLGYSFAGTNVIPQGGMVVTVDYPRSAIPAVAAGASGGLPTGDASGRVTVAPAGLDAIVVEAGLNPRQAMSLIAAALDGVLSGAGSGTITVKGAGVATTRIVATVDSSGNRSVVNLTPPA